MQAMSEASAHRYVMGPRVTKATLGGDEPHLFHKLSPIGFYVEVLANQSRPTRLLLLQDPANANNHVFEAIQHG